MPCVNCPQPQPPRNATRWIAWYTGGRRFDSETTQWAELPDVGVLGVVVFFADGGRRQCSGDDWYWQLRDGERWTIAHSRAPLEELQRVYGDQPFKRGMWVLEEEMHAVDAAMQEALSGD